MSDTTATVRKEILEDAKAEIDAQKDDATRIRDTCQYMSDPWNFWDDEIDRLQLKKDNLPQTLFHDEIEPTEAEAQALERRLAQLAEDGMYPSPIISGGDIVEIIPQAGDDDIPF